jgi:uncharacterized protein YcfL
VDTEKGPSKDKVVISKQRTENFTRTRFYWYFEHGLAAFQTLKLRENTFLLLGPLTGYFVQAAPAG